MPPAPTTATREAFDLGQTQSVHSNRQRFNQAGIAQWERGGQGNQRTGWNPHSLSDTTIDGIAEKCCQSGAAKVRRPGQAQIAGATMVLRVDRHRRSVV